MYMIAGQHTVLSGAQHWQNLDRLSKLQRAICDQSVNLPQADSLLLAAPSGREVEISCFRGCRQKPLNSARVVVYRVLLF